jgi:phage I-like protein
MMRASGRDHRSMPDVIKAALSTALVSGEGIPSDLQYMPPGKHRINASRNGKPVTLDITINASTADRLNQFLQSQLTKATEGNEDRPFFDFNHEDREAAAWPTEFYWAGDDPLTGGVRAKIEWSGAGEKAVKEKTFRRFSPTFVPDEAGHVIGSETNMGGSSTAPHSRASRPFSQNPKPLRPRQNRSKQNFMPSN